MTSHASTFDVASELYPGVVFRLRRITFRRRLELLKRLQPLVARHEHASAGSSVQEQVSAGISTAEIEHLYLDWGLVSVSGLEIDGENCTPEAMIAQGPEDLCREILGHVRKECGLTEDERKN